MAVDPPVMYAFQYWNGSAWKSADDIVDLGSCGTDCRKYSAEYCDEAANNGTRFKAAFTFPDTGQYIYSYMYEDSSLSPNVSGGVYGYPGDAWVMISNAGIDIDWNDLQLVGRLQMEDVDDYFYETYVYIDFVSCP